MGSFIGIRLPQGMTTKINGFCSELAYPLPPTPYIMLIPPFLSQSIPTIRHKLESFCLSQPEFTVQIGPPSVRGNQLLYLAVRGGKLVDMRNSLAQHLAVEVSAVYTPHVAIVRQSAGKRYDLEQLMEKAQRTFLADEQMKVWEATLFTRESPDAPYTPTMNIPFTGK